MHVQYEYEFDNCNSQLKERTKEIDNFSMDTYEK